MHSAAGETGPSAGGEQPDASTLGVARPRGGARSSTEPTETEELLGLPAGRAPRVRITNSRLDVLSLRSSVPDGRPSGSADLPLSSGLCTEWREEPGQPSREREELADKFADTIAEIGNYIRSRGWEMAYQAGALLSAEDLMVLLTPEADGDLTEISERRDVYIARACSVDEGTVGEFRCCLTKGTEVEYLGEPFRRSGGDVGTGTRGRYKEQLVGALVSVQLARCGSTRVHRGDIRPIKTSDAQAQGSSGPSARQVCDRQPPDMDQALAPWRSQLPDTSGREDLCSGCRSEKIAFGPWGAQIGVLSLCSQCAGDLMQLMEEETDVILSVARGAFRADVTFTLESYLGGTYQGGFRFVQMPGVRKPDFSSVWEGVQQQKLSKPYKLALAAYQRRLRRDQGPKKTGPPGCRGEHSTDRPSHSENRTHHQGSGPSTHSTPPCGSHLNSEQDTGRYGQGQPRLPFGRYVPPHQRGHPVDAPRNGPGDRGCTRRHSGSGGRTGNHISLDLTCPPQPQQWGQDSGWDGRYGEGSDEQRGRGGNWSLLPPAWPSSGSRYPPSGASPGLQQWYGWMRMGPSGDGGLGPQFLPGQGSGSNCLGAWGSGPAGNWHVCLGTQPGSPGEMEGQRFLPPCAGPVSGAEDVGDSRHERLEQEGEDNFKCVVCQDETRDIVLEPCRHFCACKACAEAFVSCPMCRSTIESKTQVFVS